jgi:hypothetical protein
MAHHPLAPVALITLIAMPLASQEPAIRPGLLATEKIQREGVWVMPAPPNRRGGNTRLTVWFTEQLLGDGQAYKRRSREWSGRKRRELRTAAIATLKRLSSTTYTRAAASLQKLVDRQLIFDLQRHWIINGFTCTVRTEAAIEALREVAGVASIFRSRSPRPSRRRPADAPRQAIPANEDSKPTEAFDPKRYRHPWYIRHLLVDRVWQDFGVTGSGTLNIIHDGNFVLEGNIVANIYRNPKEIAGNGKDDDGNGLIDDYCGYNFATDSAHTTITPGTSQLHGNLCAQIICGQGAGPGSVELGLAPDSRWAGVIAGSRLEAAVEWAVEQGADTYSMSFSIPRLGEYRSHWRKVLEHGSICGVYFVSGAGNFAQAGSPSFAAVPVQMRTPEDIPEVVFAAAGVQRDLSRTPFSSQGPVEWKTQHYQDGVVQKPEVCAFNYRLPAVYPDGTIFDAKISGNSFAGPMFCGSIALMLSADPDLLPWDLKEIISSTALDIGPAGVDYQTGHGLINCYRAVKEVLRRRATRDGEDPSKYRGRVVGDELDVVELQRRLAKRRLSVVRVRPGSKAATSGIRVGDLVLEVEGAPVVNRRAFTAAVQAAFRSGKNSAMITLLRNKQRLQFRLPKGRQMFSVSDSFSEPVFR